MFKNFSIGVEKVWKSVHIFYYDNHDKLLYCNILPIIQKYQIEQFFFIRYWEQGPHIRLRVKTDDDVLFDKIIQDIEKYISLNKSEATISKKYYSDMSNIYAEKERMDSQNWRILIPNNTVCRMEYVPETEKYHGEKGVEIAEREFCFSSFLALNVISKAKSKSEKMLYAAAYALELADSVFENCEKKLRFFELYRKYWENFSEITAEKKEQMMQIVDGVNGAIIRKIEGIYINHFGNFHKDIFKELGNNDKIRFDFLMNFVHLFNNRIGIIPYEEIQTTCICEKLVGEVLCKNM